MSWYYHLNGENKGPVELPELQSLRDQGVVTLDTPVWKEGMETWATYGTSTAYVPATAVAPTASALTSIAAPTHTCVECKKTFPESEMLQYEDSWVCPICKPIFFQRIKEGVAPTGTLNYASLWRRFFAYIVDILFLSVVMTLPLILIFGLGAAFGTQKDMNPFLTLGIALFKIVIQVAYEIVLISLYGATLGKMALKIKVVTPDGGPISYGRSTGRYFAKILSGLILCIGYLMAIWDPEKRALHDRLAGTRVIFVP